MTVTAQLPFDPVREIGALLGGQSRDTRNKDRLCRRLNLLSKAPLRAEQIRKTVEVKGLLSQQLDHLPRHGFTVGTAGRPDPGPVTQGLCDGPTVLRLQCPAQRTDGQVKAARGPAAGTPVKGRSDGKTDKQKVKGQRRY